MARAARLAPARALRRLPSDVSPTRDELRRLPGQWTAQRRSAATRRGRRRSRSAPRRSLEEARASLPLPSSWRSPAGRRRAASARGRRSWRPRSRRHYLGNRGVVPDAAARTTTAAAARLAAWREEGASALHGRCALSARARRPAASIPGAPGARAPKAGSRMTRAASARRAGGGGDARARARGRCAHARVRPRPCA